MKNSDRNNKYDTGKIPISQIERELIEQRNRENYEKIIKSQRKAELPRERREVQPKKKQKSGCSSIILSFILIVTIITSASLGLLYYFSSQIKYTKTEKELSDVISQAESIGDNVYNLLLIGTDKEEDGKSRSDTMMLVSVDNKNQKIKLISFMRDLWVDIGDHNGRLNSAYTFGGPVMLMKVISENFDVKIDNYMLVDFSMFEQLIDSLGGVEVEITEKEASFINRTTHATVNSGINNLNGDYALIYCRIRKLDSDFMRTQRQRKVINAIIDKAKNQNVLSTAAAITDILPLISTDIDPLKMTYLVIYMATKLDYQIDQCRIPFDDAYKNQTINGQAVLVPDIEETTEKLKEFIFE